MKLVSNIYQSLILILFLSVISIAQDGDVSKRRGRRGKTFSKSEQIKKLHKQIDEMRSKLFKVVTSRDSLMLENESLNRIIEISDIKEIDKQFKILEEKYDSLSVLNSKVIKLLNNKQNYRVKQILAKPKKYPESPLKVFRNDEGKIGYKSRDGKTIIEPRFNFVWWMEEGFIKVNEDKKWSIIDTLGNIIIKPNYHYTTIPNDSLCRVFENGYWGYLDYSENWVVIPKYLGVSKFISDTAMVIIGKDSIAYINKKDEILDYFDLLPDVNIKLTYKDFCKRFELKESYGSISSFVRYNLEPIDSRNYLMIQSPTDGEGTRNFIVKELDFGIISETQYYYEGYKLKLKIPKLSLKEGTLLLMRILGSYIFTYESNEKFTKFTTDQGMFRIKLTESPNGYIEIFEEYSL